MDKMSKSTKHLFLLVTYGIVLYVSLQHLDAVRSMLGWLFAVLAPIAYGLGIAFVINLFIKIFREKLFYRLEQSDKPWQRKLVMPLCVLMTILVAAAMIAAIIFLIIPEVTSAINMLIEKMPHSTEQLFDFINAQLIAYHAPQTLIDQVNDFNLDWEQFISFIITLFEGGKFESLVGTAFNATASFISTFTNLVLGMIIAVYIIAQKERFLYVVQHIFMLILPEKIHAETNKIITKATISFQNFLKGQFAEALIIASLCMIGLTIFRFPYAVAIGMVTGLTALIPIIGAWIGGGIGLLLIWVEAPEKALWFLIFIVVLQQLEGQFIYPKVVGSSLQLPGIIVLLAVILGGGFSGIVGILFAVPISATIYTLLKEKIDSAPKEVPAAEAVTAEPEPQPKAEPKPPIKQKQASPSPQPVKKPQPAKQRKRRKH